MAPQQETKFNTSFIPKKPVSSVSGTTIKKKGPELLTIIGLFIFFLSVLGAAGVYVWQYQIQNTIDNQIESLRKARAEFDEKTLAEATRLNERIKAVKSLLDNHVAPSNIFSLLEDTTLPTVSYNNFQYSTNEDDTIDISASGNAAGFESVVLQSDELGMSDFRDVIFSNVQPNENGQTVGFTLNANIDKSIVLYKNNIEETLSSEPEIFDSEDESASARSEFKNIFE
jgi:hypothetical protein